MSDTRAAATSRHGAQHSGAHEVASKERSKERSNEPNMEPTNEPRSEPRKAQRRDTRKEARSGVSKGVHDKPSGHHSDRTKQSPAVPRDATNHTRPHPEKRAREEAPQAGDKVPQHKRQCQPPQAGADASATTDGSELTQSDALQFEWEEEPQVMRDIVKNLSVLSKCIIEVHDPLNNGTEEGKQPYIHILSLDALCIAAVELTYFPKRLVKFAKGVIMFKIDLRRLKNWLLKKVRSRPGVHVPVCVGICVCMCVCVCICLHPLKVLAKAYV